MGRLEDIGERDGWRCWLCDEPVDMERSVNDDRGPSIAARITDRKAKKKGAALDDRLAHRACNTGKGKVKPVVEWSQDLFVVEPAVILTSVERLLRKGGREVMARCPDRDDAEQAAAWLLDRLSRLEPGAEFTTDVESGGGQYLLILKA